MTNSCWPNTVRTASSIVLIITLQPFYFDRISPAERGHGQDDGQAGFPGEGTEGDPGSPAGGLRLFGAPAGTPAPHDDRGVPADGRSPRSQLSSQGRHGT